MRMKKQGNNNKNGVTQVGWSGRGQTSCHAHFAIRLDVRAGKVAAMIAFLRQLGFHRGTCIRLRRRERERTRPDVPPKCFPEPALGPFVFSLSHLIHLTREPIDNCAASADELVHHLIRLFPLHISSPATTPRDIDDGRPPPIGSSVGDMHPIGFDILVDRVRSPFGGGSSFILAHPSSPFCLM